MTLSYIPNTELIKIEAQEIIDFINNIDDYSSVNLIGSKNCIDKCPQTLLTAEILDTTKVFYFEGNVAYLKATYFGLNAYEDGVFTIQLKFILKTGTEIYITTCLFVDITYKCLVASSLDGIIKEVYDINREKLGSTIHLLHYSLINGSNCQCSCSDMCKVFNELSSILKMNSKINTNCGCQ